MWREGSYLMLLTGHPWMFSIKVPVGWLQVEGNQYFVTSAHFEFKPCCDDFGQGEIREQAFEEFRSYVSDPNAIFRSPIVTSGSDFQQRVWTALERIPVGNTWTYGQLAEVVGSSARAVGNACRNNPIVILIPCHRVVSVQGIGGYAGAVRGDYLNVKQWLLTHEVH